MLEADIKAHLVNHLYKKCRLTDDSLVVSELTIGGFSRRVDLVVATPKELIAYEIKSASDNLSRLSGQVNDYLKYFDKVIVVADSTHIDATLQLAPENVGVWELSKEKFIAKRRGIKTTVKDKKALASFLTATEISRLTPTAYKAYDRSKQRELMLRANSAKKLRGEVYEFLYRKFSATSHKLLNKLDTKANVTPIDIEQLSVYIPERRAKEQKKALKSQLWQEWEAELSPPLQAS